MASGDAARMRYFSCLDAAITPQKMQSFWPIWVKLTRYYESISNRLWISSQFESNILQLLGIPGRILVPPMTHFLGQNDSIFFFHWSLRYLLQSIEFCLNSADRIAMWKKYCTFVCKCEQAKTYFIKPLHWI